MPLTVEAFFAVFADYNAAIWPLQILASVGGLAVVVLLRFPSRRADAAILAILAAMWLVNGVGYHLVHFTLINPAAWLFGGLFVLQAALLGAAPAIRPDAVGLHLLTGKTHPPKFRNMLGAVNDGRLAPSMIVARRLTSSASS